MEKGGSPIIRWLRAPEGGLGAGLALFVGGEALAVEAAVEAAAAGTASVSPSFLEAMGDFILSIGDGPREAVAFGLIIAMLVAGSAAIALLIAFSRRTDHQQTEQSRHIRALEVELAEMRGIVAVEPHILIRWRGAAAAEPIVTGTLGGAAKIPEDAAQLVNFGEWLERDSAMELDQSLRDLRTTGTPFDMFVTTSSSARLVAKGFAAAGATALKLRQLRGSSLEAVVDADRQADLDSEFRSLKAALAKSPVLAWLRGQDRQLAWVNTAYAEAVDSATPEIAVTDQTELIPPDARSAIDEQIARGNTAYQRIHAVVGGARRTFDVVDTPAPLGSAGIAIDVTDHDRLRDELDRHVAAHARTLDQLATAVAIFGPDETLNFFNAAYVNLWKLDETWLRQQPKDGEILDRLRDEGRLPEQADYRAWRRNRLAAYTAVEPSEEWWHLPDGQSLRVVTEPHPVGGVTHLYENVTEKFAQESRYNALFSVQRETLDNLHEGVVLIGSDGRIKLSNPSFASIWKLDVADLADEPHMDNVIARCRELAADDDHWDELRASVSAFADDRRPIQGRIERPDQVVVDYASVPLPDGATLFTYVDVSDSWRIEQALRERAEALLAADRLKTAFISHISYELRAPLTNIIGFADLLGAETFGALNDKQLEYIGFIQNSSHKLHQLIDDILDIATIDAGVMELDLGEVDIQAVLQATGALLAERIQSAGLELLYDIPDAIGGFVADETRVKQIIYNLLTNAIGFSETGGTITLGARKEAEIVELWVRDQGRGIPHELQMQIFERFVTHTEGSRHRGSGLGLSVVKSFVELHGGSIAIESELGTGTTVRLCLPLHPTTGNKGTSDQAELAGAAVSPAFPLP